MARVKKLVDIPVPKRGGGRPRKRPELFDLRLNGTHFYPMEPGDDMRSHRHRIDESAAHAKRMTGWSFTVRQVTEDGVPGVRVFRIA